MSQSQDEPNPLQGYFDWQVATLMLARDLNDPITPGSPGDQQAAFARRAQVEQEVRDMVMDLLPEKYKQDESLDWPPELMMQITRATLGRAAEIAGM